MAERIRIAPGMFRVSKPGVNVLSAGEFDLIFSEAAGGLIPAVSGIVTRPGSASYTAQIPLPEPGYMPLIYMRNATSPEYSAEDAASITSYVNQEKTLLFLFMPAVMNRIRYVIFKNRQF